MHQLESKLPPPAPGKIDFDQQIRPIFEQSCLRCHGPERPKSRFRLDSKEGALKGGENGVDLVPGNSARSPLVYYVARLVEDMEMPPTGKAEPLSREQVGLLRAWIDQGAAWSTTQTNLNKVAFSVTPMLQWFTVKGNEQKFREQTGLKEGWSRGVQSIFLQEQQGPDRKVTFEGTLLANPEEYRLKLQVDQRDFGFIHAGFEQYSDFYADTGGYYPGLPSPALNRDLRLDVGRAWIDFGLTLPDWPKIVLGYEYQYREGSQSLLEWGDLGTIANPTLEVNPSAASDARKIYPAARDMDERVHIVKLDVTHEINGIGIENNFRSEFYDNQTGRGITTFYNPTLPTNNLDQPLVSEQESHFQASDAIRLDKQLRDWLYVSGGYYFSRLDGDYSLKIQPNFPNGAFPFIDRYYFTDSIILDQNTHVINGNLQLGPWGGLTLYGGVQSQWMSQRGFGNVEMADGPANVPLSAPGPLLDANLDRMVVEEYAGARYTAIPFTVLFAEGRFAREDISQMEQRMDGVTESFLRDTDAHSDLEEGRVGFTLSPWTRVSLTTQFRKRHKDWDYDHLQDIDLIRGSEGYSAFITGRDMLMDEVSSKLAIRAASWLKVNLTYQIVASDWQTATEPITGLTPGGGLYAANYDASIYSASLSLTPFRRVYLSSTFSWENSRTATADNYNPAIVNYEGDVYSSISSLTYMINQKTDLLATYTYSWADYGQGNYATGLPLGLVYQWHGVTAGITRRWTKNISTNLQYQFYSYNEENTGGINDYVAHGILASLTMALR